MRCVAHVFYVEHMHSPEHEAPDLITTAEVAVLAKVDPATVNRWARNGRLPVALKVAGIRGPNLFNRSDVLTALAEQDVA